MMIRSWRALLTAMLLLSCNGCKKESGEAIVIGKEHVPAAEKVEPTASPAVSPTEQNEAEYVEVDPDAPDPRGTSKDPRAVDHEQWIVNVQMVEDGRKIDVRVEQSKWNATKEGERVRVVYRQGKYTGTVWHADIVEK